MPRTVRVLLGILAAHLAIGMGAYLHFVATGRYDVIDFYFGYEGACFLIAMPCVEIGFAAFARSAFESDEPMRLAWTMILLSAALRFCGAVCANISHAPPLHDAGLVVGGPAAMALLAAGLARIVSLQRRFHLADLIATDYLLLAFISGVTVRQAWEVGNLLLVSHLHPAATQAMLWFSDPLLTLLLAETVVIRRSLLNIGGGLVARCWGAISLGVIFTSAGNLLTWLNRQDILPEILQPIAWYTWFAAAAAFAIAPCFQAAATAQARHFEPAWVARGVVEG